MSRTTKAKKHCWMPDGTRAVCSIPDSYIKNGENITWNVNLVTCRQCISRLNKRPQLANQVMKARQPDLPAVDTSTQQDLSALSFNEKMRLAIQKLRSKNETH